MENHFNCIYCYTNKVNGKKYIGQTVDFIKRHNSHIWQTYNEKQKCDYNVPFHNAIRKHGIENFEIEILKENLQNQDELNYWECYYIVEFNTLVKNQKGYNLADGGSNGNPLAGKLDEELAEIFKKISEAHKGENNPRARKVVSVDQLTKQIVFIWQYKQQATKFYGINHTTLDYYLKGKAKSGHEYNGFLWYYLDEYEQLTK